MNVEMTISGDVTGGMFGTDPENWKRKEDIVAPGEILDDLFGRAAGANTPMLYVRWEDEDGKLHLDTVEIPFPP
ncbi:MULTISPECIES: hypothetical protein [unclassified Mycobacterium]|uniref:hypothetical protein n=1 Tax=unclassified Mycobacterium TaxID=2642494 RepID=UPI0012E984F9|nr:MULTISPECIES: hypothetical protein [unclassified Mycobacterium]